MAEKHAVLFTNTRFGFIDLLVFENDNYLFSGSVITVSGNDYGFYYNRDNTRVILYSKVSSILYINAMVAELFTEYQNLWNEYKDIKKHIKVNFPQINNTPQEIDEELIDMLYHAEHLVNVARGNHERAYILAAKVTQEFCDYGR